MFEREMHDYDIPMIVYLENKYFDLNYNKLHFIYNEVLHKSNEYCFVIEHDNELISYIYFTHINSIIYFKSLIVKEKFQHKGIGNTLYNKMIKISKELKCETILSYSDKLYSNIFLLNKNFIQKQRPKKENKNDDINYCPICSQNFTKQCECKQYIFIKSLN
jgi:predicted N-acetyltransferase YhbS